MIGIENIASYIAEGKKSNYEVLDKFGIDESFIRDKIGVEKIAIAKEHEKASDLCFKAIEKLKEKTNFDPSKLEVIIVVTQNPDYQIPQTSSIVHGMIDAPTNCASYDISLGCSGYVYGLADIIAFMERHGMKHGLLLTADPYSKIVDPDDKNTSMIFGDAATATLIGENPILTLHQVDFGTDGKAYEHLMTRDGKLYMNGQAVFKFAARVAPKSVQALLDKAGTKLEYIDKFILHQGSKKIVDTVAKKLHLKDDQYEYSIQDYGNTVSSSIPILLEKELIGKAKTLIMCGFGVGLSWASALLKRV